MRSACFSLNYKETHKFGKLRLKPKLQVTQNTFSLLLQYLTTNLSRPIALGKEFSHN